MHIKTLGDLRDALNKLTEPELYQDLVVLDFAPEVPITRKRVSFDLDIARPSDCRLFSFMLFEGN